MTVRSPRARTIVTELRERGVYVDARNDLLRIGPAPFLADDELEHGVEVVARTLQ